MVPEHHALVSGSAATHAHRGAPAQRERGVAAQLRADIGELRHAQPGLPEFVAGGRSAAAPPPPLARPAGIFLRMTILTPGAAPAADIPGHSRAHSEVRLPCRAAPQGHPHR